MSADQKLRCAIIYRLEGAGPTAIPLAKYDHASEVESHTSADSQLYGGKKADFAKAVARVVGNDPPRGLSQGVTVGGFKVVQSDEHQVVYGADLQNICYCVITGLGYGNRIAIKFLEELAKDFQAKYAAEAQKAKENGLTAKCKKLLKEKCVKYETPDNVDKTSKVLKQVDAVKAQMQDNIAGMLKNQESAQSLNEKSQQLNEQAGVFKKNSKKLKDTMWWKNMKTNCMLFCVVLVVLAVIALPIIANVKMLLADTGGGGGGGGGEGKSGTGNGNHPHHSNHQQHQQSKTHHQN